MDEKELECGSVEPVAPAKQSSLVGYLLFFDDVEGLVSDVCEVLRSFPTPVLLELLPCKTDKFEFVEMLLVICEDCLLVEGLVVGLDVDVPTVDEDAKEVELDLLGS
ncbi:hypothetical protein WICPIJ_003135 [Wickerhamomyces pijperi]|uniref:Uncharacterized protein n=1 Tax=Wickerhamomyces pijperi TaxID=599730 RepID=A0A9P8QA55_WICPI|nr:hypothetical protein WICPIJ_003135 [Wickerhamomyces pijperi]